jgi:hypothetical protein
VRVAGEGDSGRVIGLADRDSEGAGAGVEAAGGDAAVVAQGDADEGGAPGIGAGAEGEEGFRFGGHVFDQGVGEDGGVVRGGGEFEGLAGFVGGAGGDAAEAQGEHAGVFQQFEVREGVERGGIVDREGGVEEFGAGEGTAGVAHDHPDGTGSELVGGGDHLEPAVGAVAGDDERSRSEEFRVGGRKFEDEVGEGGFFVGGVERDPGAGGVFAEDEVGGAGEAGRVVDLADRDRKRAGEGVDAAPIGAAVVPEGDGDLGDAVAVGGGLEGEEGGGSRGDVGDQGVGEEIRVIGEGR